MLEHQYILMSIEIIDNRASCQPSKGRDASRLCECAGDRPHRIADRAVYPANHQAIEIDKRTFAQTDHYFECGGSIQKARGLSVYWLREDNSIERRRNRPELRKGTAPPEFSADR